MARATTPSSPANQYHLFLIRFSFLFPSFGLTALGKVSRVDEEEKAARD